MPQRPAGHGSLGIVLRGELLRRVHLLAGRGGDAGQALLFVVIALALLVSVPFAIATTTVDQLPQTTRNLNWDAAYEAAQAGLNDYLQHLDADESYAQYSRSNADGNPAFSGWVQLSTTPIEYYSYAPTVQSGLIALTVSGRAGNGPTAVVRTFAYSIRPATTLNDVYWSNYETIDPTVAATEPHEPADNAYCATHYGEPSTDSYPNGPSGGVTIPAIGPPNDCVVQFYSGDVLDGPVFSDDTFRMCGTPQFLASVLSGNSYSSSIYTTAPGSCTPVNPATTFLGPAPQTAENAPPQTATADQTPAMNHGCYIAGGGNTTTNVTMSLSVSGSTTTVTWSGTGASVQNAGSNTNDCASPILVSSLSSGLIYVNGSITVSGTMTGALDIVAGTNSTTPANITVAGNLTYPAAHIATAANGLESDPDDVLGLIANNSVEVAEVTNMTIDAAVLALKDSFYVQDWQSGSYGTLTVFGSIAQNFRGPVGTTGGTGFTKSYHYDSSLQSLWPPYFIPPQGVAWSATSFSELPAGLASSVCPAC